MKTGVVIVIVVLLSLLGLGYFQYKEIETGSTPVNQGLSALTTAFSASVASSNADISQVSQLLSVLDQVTTLSQLDVDFFRTPLYTSLKDFSVTLFPAQSVGRKNPFLELDEEYSASTAQKQTSLDTSAKTTKNTTITTGSTTANDTTVVSNNTTTDQSFTPSVSNDTPPNSDNFVDDSVAQQDPGTVDQSASAQQATGPICDPFANPECLNSSGSVETFFTEFDQ